MLHPIFGLLRSLSRFVFTRDRVQLLLPRKRYATLTTLRLNILPYGDGGNAESEEAALLKFAAQPEALRVLHQRHERATNNGLPAVIALGNRCFAPTTPLARAKAPAWLGR